MRRTPLVAAAAALLLAPAGAAAEAPPAPPMLLPGDAAAAGADADPSTWLLGVRPGTGVPGGRRVAPGAYEVPREHARDLARALGDRLTFAEPNHYRAFHQRAVADDPLTPHSRWRDAVIDPALQPPPVGPDSPLLALIDAKAQVGHREFTGAPVRTLPRRTVRIGHGTETMGVAVAPVNDIGIVGAYPGARALNVPLPASRITCGDSADGIRRAIRARAAVINMSYGSLRFCQAEYQALQRATHAGITLVAASGNERLDGNPFEFPASLPHVLTIGALQPDDRAAPFSNTGGAIDLVAPGVGIIAPLPVALDREDDRRDGYEVVAGTSFAAPIVAAAAIWVRAARPRLSVDQVAQVVRLSATDIHRRGYDPETGYGKLNMTAALAKKPPERDPLEPNDDMQFVDGRAFRRPARLIWRGRGTTRLTALIDRFEDPGDVYRFRVPARSRVTITVRPEFGNPDLEVHRSGSRTVRSRKGLIARSRRGAGKQDRLRLRNRTGRRVSAFIHVYPRGRILDSRYRLTVR